MQAEDLQALMNVSATTLKHSFCNVQMYVLYLVLYQACQWEVIKQVCEVPPDIRIAILSETFIIEAIPVGEGLHSHSDQHSTAGCKH